MYKVLRVTIGATFGGILAGCASNPNLPLFFAQTNTFGVSAHGSTSSQGVDLTVGYKGSDIAIVPVTATGLGGKVVLIAGTANDNLGDALSVFGHFARNTKVDTAATVGLSSFFATEVAAQQLAVGFRERLKKDQPLTGAIASGPAVFWRLMTMPGIERRHGETTGESRWQS